MDSGLKEHEISDSLGRGMSPERATRKICVFTGTRAEYGLLRPVMTRLAQAEGACFQLVVSGSHLSASGGQTENQIIRDGFEDFERVEILLDGGGEASVYTAMGLGLLRYGDVLVRLRPDIVVVLGDRFEAFAFAAAATVCRVPIAHIHGGELTLGAMDDAFRHAITKMSHLHFAATEEYRRRIIQLGERHDRVFNVGSLGVQNVRAIKPLSRSEVEGRLGLSPGQRFILATYHPVTLDAIPSVARLKELLAVLENFPDHMVVFTGANADQEGAVLNRLLENSVREHPSRMRFFVSLGPELYLSTARFADCVIGNSSSGIIEIPSLGVPVVDIGTRQKGRVRSSGILTSSDRPDDIQAAIARSMTPDFSAIARRAENPYEKKGTDALIVSTLLTFPTSDLLTKGFVDLPA